MKATYGLSALVTSLFLALKAMVAMLLVAEEASSIMSRPSMMTWKTLQKVLSAMASPR